MFASRVLINSLPKSGTHLLTKAIEIFGYKEYATHRSYPKRILDYFGWGTPRFLNYKEAKKSLKKTGQEEQIGVGVLTPYRVNLPTLRYWLERIPEGQYIQGHLPYTSVLHPLIENLNYRHLVIIRDPRAVIASLLPFVLAARPTGMGDHFLAEDFKLMSPSQRLNFILEGGYAPQAKVHIKSFAEVYNSLLAWREQPGCLLIHFEDLVGPQGGGNIERQIAVIKNISSHLDLPWDEKNKLTKDIYDSASRTFRMGKIDGWKNSLSHGEIHRLIQYCEPLCDEWGYNT